MAMLVHQPTNSVGNYNYNAYFYKGYKMYYHFHSNYEVVYMVSGKAEVMIDNRTEELEKGAFALILPNQLHSFQAEEGAEMWVCVFSEEYVFLRKTGKGVRHGISDQRYDCGYRYA